MVFSAFGDALGAPYEFNEIAVEPGVPLTMQPYGRLRRAAGRWTDDSAMAVATALGLLAPGDEQAKLDAVARRYRSWAWEDGAGMGNQTRSILRWSDEGVDAEFMLRLSRDHHRLNPDSSAGNGSIMRIHPVSLFSDDRHVVARWARAVTELVYADPAAWRCRWRGARSCASPGARTCSSPTRASTS